MQAAHCPGTHYCDGSTARQLRALVRARSVMELLIVTTADNTCNWIAITSTSLARKNNNTSSLVCTEVRIITPERCYMSHPNGSLSTGGGLGAEPPEIRNNFTHQPDPLTVSITYHPNGSLSTDGGLGAEPPEIINTVTYQHGPLTVSITHHPITAVCPQTGVWGQSPQK
jgi:hypothetical protein